jgi:Methyltransferase small domain
MILPSQLLVTTILASGRRHSTLSSTNAAASSYAQARQVRLEQGASAAAPLYQELLAQYPDDLTTATRLGAANATINQRLFQVCSYQDELSQFRAFLQRENYTTAAVAKAMNYPQAVCPIYVVPAAAGTVTQYPWQDDSPTPLCCLIALFLVGLAIPRAVLDQCWTSHMVNLLLDQLSLLARDHDDMIFSLVSIMPIQYNVYIATDWHPRVLSATSIVSHDQTHDAVMYIGPDSCALMQYGFRNDFSAVIDFCTGSGVQAVVALARSPSMTRALCVDINPRALRFVQWNAALNFLDSSSPATIQVVLANLTAHQKDSALLNIVHTFLEQVQSNDPVLVTANPPFLPVPPILWHRHGLFSAGGPSGENVLAAVITLVAQLAARRAIFLAIVSEFFLQAPVADNSEHVERAAYSALPILNRIHRWWKTGYDEGIAAAADSLNTHPVVNGVLVTNECPVAASVYAERRASSRTEYEIWIQHLQAQGIDAVSPGLLFISSKSSHVERRVDGGLPYESVVSIRHRELPKSRYGSLWTPYNPLAAELTKEEVTSLLTEGP